MFGSGVYYVGDPGFVLPNDDLRGLFSQTVSGILETGFKEVIVSRQHTPNGQIISDQYWVAKTPAYRGTLYDQNNKGWGFDWGCFGVIAWKWLDIEGCYDSNKIEFTSPFECFATEDGITIGHLHFTFNPK